MLIDVTLCYYFYCNQTNNQTSGISEDFAIFLFDLYVFIYKNNNTHTFKINPWEETTLFQEL